MQRRHRAYLIRHGETAWSLTGQHTSITDIPLTEAGRATASTLAPILASINFTRVFTSPLTRARETCNLAGFERRAEVERDLVEWNYGEYEGLTSDQIEAKSPGWQLFRDGCPGGERPGDVRARVDRVIAKTQAIDGDVAIFAHGHVFRVLAARWIGLDVDAASRFLLDTGTLSILGYYRGTPAMELWNSRPH